MMKPRFTSTTWFRRNLFALGIALGVAAFTYFGYLNDQATGGLLGNVEAKLIDLRFKLRGTRQPTGEVVIVAIDSKSTEQLGRFPWSRTTHAALIDRLREWGATTVAFDVLFTEEEGAEEAAHLHRIAATLPPGDALEATQAAIDGALAEIEVDKIFSAALEKTYEADAAWTVLSFDFVFPEDLSHTRQLGQVLSAEDEQTVLDVASYLSDDDNSAIMRNRPPHLALGVRPVVAELANWTALLGYANPRFDSDGALRREQLLVVYSPSVRESYRPGGDPTQVLADPQAVVQAYQPLSVAGVATHLRLAADQLILDLSGGELRFPIPSCGEERIHHFDRYDGTTRLDFYGPSRTFPTYSFADVLSDSLTAADGSPIDGPAAFNGKLVFVGATDPGIGDFFVTPFTSRLPGVEKHATAAENLLTGRQLYTHTDVYLVIGITALVASVATALLVANLSTTLAGPGLLLLGLGGFGYTYLDFINKGLVWNWVVPGTTLVLGFAAVVAYRAGVERRAKRAMEERGRFIKQTFSRYLSDEVVDVLVESPEGLELGGERRRLTIMMSDLRGFTALCERSEPEEVIGLLNNYLGRMTEIIFKYGGTVDEFIGDAILALFGAPMVRDDDARRAVACAIEMQQAMAGVNQRLKDHGLPEVEMGIALNTGEVIVGNIGSEMRAKYGVVGSNVNLTARIESYTVGGQVFISGETFREAGDLVEVGARIDVKAKGLAEPVPAYEVRGIGGNYQLQMPEIREELVELPQPIAVEYSVLEGKHLTDEMVAATFTRLSALGADLRCKLDLEPLINLKLAVTDSDGTRLEGDLYAKVIDREAASGCCALRFTATPPAVKKYFDQVRKSLKR